MMTARFALLLAVTRGSAPAPYKFDHPSQASPPVTVAAVSCKGEDGEFVDYLSALKVHGSAEYYYRDATSPAYFSKSPHELTTNASGVIPPDAGAIMETLRQLYERGDSFAYALYPRRRRNLLPRTPLICPSRGVAATPSPWNGDAASRRLAQVQRRAAARYAAGVASSQQGRHTVRRRAGLLARALVSQVARFPQVRGTLLEHVRYATDVDFDVDSPQSLSSPQVRASSA